MPPLLNLDPGDFFAELVEHYLFAAVNQLCYASLTAENNRRLHHNWKARYGTSTNKR